LEVARNAELPPLPLASTQNLTRKQFSFVLFYHKEALFYHKEALFYHKEALF